MALRLVSPAPLADVADLTRMSGTPASLRKFAGGVVNVATRLVNGGPSYVAYDEGGQAIAAGGYIDLGGGLREGWFACVPHASARILSIVRLAQLTIPPLRQDGAIKVTGRVAPGWRPGQRIARLLGMSKGPIDMGYEIWERAL